MKITDEMVGAAMLAYMKETAAEEFQVSGWLESALRAALTAALAVQTQQGVKAIRAQAIEDVLAALTAHELYQYRPKAFKGFIEYARTTLVSEEEASVWRSALVDVPAVESEPVAWQKRHCMPGHYGWSSWESGRAPTTDFSGLKWEERPLYAHPPRSLSNEGSEMLHLAVEAVLEADAEFRAQMMPGWDGDPLSDELDGLRRIFTALSTRKGSAEGDGAATSTNGGEP